MTTESTPPAVVLPGLNLIGWVPPAPDLSIEHWGRTLDALMSFEQATPWALGDLYLFAQSRGKEFEERAQQLIPTRANHTILNYAVVCRVFPRHHRRSNLRMKHHIAVITLARKSMDEAQRWLEIAERDEMSAASLYKAVNGGSQTALETTAEKTEADIGWQGPMLAEAAALIKQFRDYSECRDWLIRYNHYTSSDAAK